MSGISLVNAKKTYLGGTAGVEDISFDVADGEFAAIVGPSGCGKTTVLKLIAGLEKLTAGELVSDGVVINDVEPKERDMAMIFENYSLMPNKTVYDNLAYGLKIRRVDKAEIRSRVSLAAELLEITDILEKKPKALGLAEIKRVELARAAVRRPKVFLMDEPLKGLDGRARIDILTAMLRLWHELKITFVYSTQSFSDASALNVKTAIMKDGVIRQIGKPRELYEKPSDIFVACYTGSAPINLFDAELETEGKSTYAVFGENRIEINAACDGENVILGVRPENMILGDDGAVTATVDAVEPLGKECFVYMQIDGKADYAVARADGCSYCHGEKIRVSFDRDKLLYFDPVTERAINFDK